MLRSILLALILATVLCFCTSSQAENPGETTLADELASAAYNGDLPTVKSSLNAGADANAKHGEALYCALLQGHDAVGVLLLETRAAIDTTGETQRGTTLMNAASSHCTEALRWLLARHVHTNTKDDKGWTALMLAAHKNDVEVAQLLVGYGGTKLNLRNWGGQTALHIAARANALEFAQYLLRCGADPTIKNDSDETALDVARYNCTCSWEGEAYTGKAKQMVLLLQRHARTSSNRSNRTPANRHHRPVFLYIPHLTSPLPVT